MFEQFGLIILAVITAITGWALIEVTKLRAEAIKEVKENTAQEWHWLFADLAKTFVKAAYQKFENEDTKGKYKYVRDEMYKQFSAYGFVVDDTLKTKIDALIESAYLDFKREMGVGIISKNTLPLYWPYDNFPY